MLGARRHDVVVQVAVDFVVVVVVFVVMVALVVVVGLVVVVVGIAVVVVECGWWWLLCVVWGFPWWMGWGCVSGLWRVGPR